jgi:tripartite-type tricarboxylate transporter receptor subunit TctC
MTKLRNFLVAATMFCAAGLMASAKPAEAKDFYKGKSMNFIVGYGTGGSYNAYSRLIAAHIVRFLPGKPSIKVQNMPGAGSVRATNHLYKVAAQDGTTIGMIDQAIQAFELLGRKGLKADVSKFNWLGRIVTNSAVLFSWHKSPIKKIEDALTTQFIVSASGSASRLNWTILNNVVGTKIKLITGYRGSGPALLAVERGEIEGLSRPWSAMKASQADWLRDGKIQLLLQTGAKKNADLPNVPRMIDLAKNAADRKLLEFFASPSQVGRSVVAPPGVPAKRVALLRSAFWKAIHDDKFKSDLKRSRLMIEPLEGAKLQALVAASTKVSPDLLKRAKTIAAKTPKRKRGKKKKKKKKSN